MWKFLILLLTFLGISNAKPAISNRGKDPFNGPPKPFSFKYGVTDEETGSNFDHAQQQDSNGVVTGEYRVNLPDGRVQIVSYTASAEKGYVANVRYEGKARYPETPKPVKRSEKKKRKVVNPYMKFKEKQRRHGDGHVLPQVVSLSPSPQVQQQQLGLSSYYEI